MKLIHTVIIVAVSASLGACIIAPPRPPMVYTQPAQAVAVAQSPTPVAVSPVYAEPSYPQPAYGYFWAFNPYYGWGWRHSHYGWHRGWR